MIRFDFGIWSYDLKCRLLKKFRGWQNWLKSSQASSTFLFVLSPPYVGSTLMQELLSTSPNISPNNIFGTREGLGLPEARKHFDYKELWNEAYTFPWSEIKKVWKSYWDFSKPVLLEKSIPNFLHALAIEQNFNQAYFIVMTRNPYAHCQSMMRRDKQTATEAAQFVLKCLKMQKANLDQCKRSILIRYEDLVNEPKKSRDKMILFLLEIEKININRHFKAHNFKNRPLPITNLNQEKIAKLSAEQIQQISQVLQSEKSLLSFFDYTLI